jgi:hypothetical protein
MGLSVISAKSDSPPASPSAKKNPSIQVLHLSVIDLQGEDQRKQKNLKKSTGCTGNWDTMKLKLALDCAFEKIPVGATTHCIIELQGVMKNAGSIGIHEVIGACKMSCEMRTGRNVVRMPARNKMKRFGIPTGLKRKDRKNMATKKTIAWLNETNQKNEFFSILAKNKKCDDMCDSLLQGIAYAESLDFKNVCRKKAKTSSNGAVICID